MEKTRRECNQININGIFYKLALEALFFIKIAT